MLKDIFKVFTSNVVKMFSSILVTFFLPKMLSIDDYAYIKLFQLFSSYIGVFSFGYNDGIFLKYGGQKLGACDSQSLSNEHSTLLVYQIALTMIIALVAVFLREFYLVIWALSFLPTTLITFYTYMYQTTGEFALYAKVTNLNSILTLLVNAVLLFLFKAEVYQYFIVGYCLTNYTVFGVAYLKFRKKSRLRGGHFSYSSLRQMMKSGFLLMVGNLVYIFFTGLDKWFSKGVFGMEAFAHYSFAAQILTVINMFITPVSLTLFSYFKRMKSTEYERVVFDLLQIVLALMLCCVFIFKIIVEKYIGKYSPAIPIFQILFVSQIFLTMNTAVFVNLYKVYQMQNKYFTNLLITVGASVLANCVGCVVFKSNIGLAFATLLCMVLWTLLNMKDFEYMQFKIKDIVFWMSDIMLYGLCCLMGSTVVGGGAFTLGTVSLIVAINFNTLKRIYTIIRAR